jgi:hypothetical protein
MAKPETNVDYNQLIDELSSVEIHTVRSERRRALRRLSKFLSQEGFAQLGVAVLKFSRTLE